MAKPKTAQRVTFSVPAELLRWADSLAEVMGLDRYDVIRVAISQGLLVMQMQRELQVNPDAYREGLQGFVRGEAGAAEQLAGRFGERLGPRVKDQIEEHEQAGEKRPRARRKPAA
jgi:hypothetical protein